MKLLDANAILRFLLNDIKEQAAEVAQAIRGGAITTPEVLAEVVYVLSGLYGMPRNEVSWALHCVLIDVKVENARALRYAL
ncbi:MAG: PIN domain nuclease, partial [Spirochaetales bacterium]|nr:PIN domain nuclease [Spirochaetales bacterium]